MIRGVPRQPMTGLAEYVSLLAPIEMPLIADRGDQLVVVHLGDGGSALLRFEGDDLKITMHVIGASGQFSPLLTSMVQAGQAVWGRTPDEPPTPMKPTATGPTSPPRRARGHATAWGPA
jgi:hypothetical protein